MTDEKDRLYPGRAQLAVLLRDSSRKQAAAILVLLAVVYLLVFMGASIVCHKTDGFGQGVERACSFQGRAPDFGSSEREFMNIRGHAIPKGN